MVKSKKLTKKEIKQFKALLITLKLRLADDLSQIEKDYLKKNLKDLSGDISGHAFHMADMASDASDAEFNISLAENQQEIVKRIEEALRKIDEGTYGLCEKYKEPIPKERLKAIPWARYCVRAQEELEKAN